MAVGGSALDPGQTTRHQMATGNSRVSRHTISSTYIRSSAIQRLAVIRRERTVGDLESV